MTDTATLSPSARRSYELAVLPLTDALYGRALKLTRNPAEAEDLVQEALIRALRFWDSYDPEQAIKPWMFTVLRNTFHNRYEALNRRRDIQTALVAEEVAVAEAPMLPCEAMEADEVAARVREAVEALPVEFREAVTLVDLQGLGYYEAADTLGVPKGTVMSRLHRGRKRLRALLEGAAA